MISNFLTYFCFRHLVIFVFLVNGFFCIAQTPFNKDNIDPTILNNFIQKELNSFRKRAKVDPVKTEFALSFAADDHSAYMLKKKRSEERRVGKKCSTRWLCTLYNIIKM